MEIFLFNAKWMFYNVMLAVLPILIGYFLLLSKAKILRILFGILWLAFLPNTIYLYTDLLHLVSQFEKVVWWLAPLLVLQHALLQVVGVITFILAYRPFEIYVNSSKRLARQKLKMIVLFNLLIAYGVVLGRVERVNSWELFSDPARVFNSAVQTLITPSSLGLLFLLWIVTNCVYFLFNKPVMRLAQQVYRRSSQLMHN